MRKLVLVVIALLALFALFRAYSDDRSTSMPGVGGKASSFGLGNPGLPLGGSAVGAPVSVSPDLSWSYRP